MTVAELKDILNDFRDDVEVFIDDTSGEIRDIYGGICTDNEKEFLLIVT